MDSALFISVSQLFDYQVCVLNSTSRKRDKRWVRDADITPPDSAKAESKQRPVEKVPLRGAQVENPPPRGLQSARLCEEEEGRKNALLT